MSKPTPRDAAKRLFAERLRRAFDEITDPTLINEVKRGKKAWLARQLGVTNTAIKRYFRGEALPEDDKILKIADVLNIPMSELEFALKENILGARGFFSKSVLELPIPMLSLKDVANINGDLTKFITREDIKVMWTEISKYPKNSAIISIEDDSMTAVDGFSLPIGSEVIAEVASDATIGNIVFFSRDGEEKARIGILSEDMEGGKIIRFLNPKLTSIKFDETITIQAVAHKIILPHPKLE